MFLSISKKPPVLYCIERYSVNIDDQFQDNAKYLLNFYYTTGTVIGSENKIILASPLIS